MTKDEAKIWAEVPAPKNQGYQLRDSKETSKDWQRLVMLIGVVVIAAAVFADIFS